MLYSSDDEGIVPVLKNKENRAPSAFALTANEPEVASKSIKQQPANKRKGAAAVASKSTSTKSNKSSKSKAAPAPESDEEGEVDAEEEEQDEEVVEETQDDPMEIEPVAKKGSKKTVANKSSKSGKKGKTVVEDEEEEEDKLSSREKRLMEKLELKSKALLQVQEAFKQLSELRHTKAEESEQQLSTIAAERQAASLNTIQLYTSENEGLRADLSDVKAELLDLKKHGYISPNYVQDQEQDATRLAELEAAVEQHEQERASWKEKAATEERKKLQERDHKWEKELARTIKAKDEESAKLHAQLQLDLAAASQDLQAEVQHSKSLQAKLKAAPAIAGGVVAPLSGDKGGKLAEEVARLNSHLALNEDLTGFSVVSVKTEENGESYSCMLNDAAGKAGCLAFRLTFHLDSTVAYTPDLDAERDAMLLQLLPGPFQQYMRFGADKCSEWFRKLFFAVNKHPSSAATL